MFKKFFIFKILIIFLLMLAIGCTNSGKITPIGQKQTKISKNFTLEEATHSDYGAKHHIKNKPNKRQLKNIKYTAKRMDDVCKILGRKIIVTSWFRAERINKKIGGSESSAHQDGLAVDFYLTKGNAKNEFDKLKKRMKYDQLIYYRNKTRAHIGFRENGINERHQVMTK